jgi:iron complex outermembrane receptor protein
MKAKFLLLFLLFAFTLQAQHVVTGTVVDELGESLISVNIVEKSTTNGTVTDLNGAFTISVSSPDAVLVFSYVGYQSVELALEGQKVVNVILLEGNILSELQVVGTRSYNRSATNSPVAIDIIDVAELSNSTGKLEINQILQYAAPSFNATKQSGSDGADHIDPASLRGLGPDQTLVLINGKRRHQSSLVNVFGTRGRGNSGTDLNAIPASAIKRIEVLRDGASAQYGSDAIAGVINVVLRDGTDGLSGGITYGAYSTAVGGNYEEIFGDDLFNVGGTDRELDPDGDKKFDGGTVKVDLNYGVGFGKNNGFINFTTEYLTKNRTLRPGFNYRKGYGSAAADQFQFMVNGAVPFSETTELYFFGGMGHRDTDAFAFTRGAAGVDGDDRTVASLYPDGFTPRITSIIKDMSVTAGVRHEMKKGLMADFSHTFGYNNFHYYIKGTNNASLGSASPTEFDAGGHSLGMNVTVMDFSKYYEDVLAGLNIAFGTEYRTENFKIFEGEVGSYATYDTLGIEITNPAIQVPFVNEFGQQAPGGAQGFPGYSPANKVDKNRSNIGFYTDLELSPIDQILIAAALRFENYSDFGNTLNFKIAARFKIVDGLSLRGSVSSGFRAPSLTQIHYNLLFNNIVAGESLVTLLAANTSTVAKSFGIEPLKEEKAYNFAVGTTYTKKGFTGTIDAYQINVKDRIVLTDLFDATALNVGAEAAQFFANGVDTRTRGIDLILGYKHNFKENNFFNVNVAANFNDTKIEKIKNGDLNVFTFFGPFAQAYLEAAAPDFKIGMNFAVKIGDFDAQLNYTQFSKVTLQDFQWVDTPPTTQEEADALFEVATDIYKSVGTLDLSVGYSIIDHLKFTIGVNNLLNKYPTPQFDGWTDQGGFNDSVQMGSDGLQLFASLRFNL